MHRILRKLVIGGLLLAVPGAAFAQSEIKVARQFGIGYLQFILMEHEKLIEKHAKAEGVPDLAIKWMQVSGGSTINDGLISGSLDVAAVGTPPLIVLWAKTKGEVRAVSAMNSYPMYLNTRNPSIKSIKDFADPSRIAVPAVKVSSQAIALQMAAAKAFVARMPNVGGQSIRMYCHGPSSAVNARWSASSAPTSLAKDFSAPTSHDEEGITSTPSSWVGCTSPDRASPSVKTSSNPRPPSLIPSQLEAEAWGSRSTRSTRRPSWPSAAARLTAVVVLPLPPF